MAGIGIVGIVVPVGVVDNGADVGMTGVQRGLVEWRWLLRRLMEWWCWLLLELLSLLLSNMGDDLEGFHPLVGIVYMAPTFIAENQSRTCRTVVR
jgi:hypothetical protein